MKTLFWCVVGIIAALFGIELYRAKKAGNTFGDQVKGDWNKVKDKAASSLDELQKKNLQEEPVIDKTVCPTCGCQDVAVNTDCPNCHNTRTE